MSITLSELNVYPIKSARGIAMRSAEITDRGLRHDRRWMLVDATGRFMTQREFPRMALIDVSVSENSLNVRAPAMKNLHIPFSVQQAHAKPVVVWHDLVEAVPMGESADTWFSQFLGSECQLVFMPEYAHRAVDRGFAFHDEIVSFADAFPMLLISEASLDDLNSRMSVRLPMSRFRPNLVVSGCEAYAEDSWHEIMVGDVWLHVVKPCARCAITTVDQETGMRGDEPLRTLASYRKRDGKVYFGQNLLHAQDGALHLGDNVSIISRREPE
ncbi:MAG: MOSC domain-containing protein [Bacteroidota bacterium]